MKTTRFLAMAALMAALGSASASDSVQVHSPRGKELPVKTTRGYVDRYGIQFQTRGGGLAERSASTNQTNDRDLVKESRQRVYTGRNAAHPQSFEIAPVK